MATIFKSVSILVLSFAMSQIVSSNVFAGQVVYSKVPANIKILKNKKGTNSVQIRVSGVLRNSCMSKGETTANVVGDQIYVQNFVIQSDASGCLMFLRPYKDSVVVKDLTSGTYDVLVLDKFGNYQDMISFDKK